MARWAIIFLVLIGAWALVGALRPAPFKVVFFNIGEGNSTLIETPHRSQILIDGGPSSRIISLLGSELPFYDHHLDAIVVTHYDSDHFYGIVEVLKRYQVDEIFLPPSVKEETNLVSELKNILSRRQMKVIQADSESDFALDGAGFDFLSPLPQMAQENLSENDMSLILHIAYQSFDLLAMGDASSLVEERFLSDWPPVEVLQVAHHGSATSTSLAFLEQIRPKLAVISVGRNNYGHPTQAVLSRLQQAGVKTVRTDQLGTIKLFLRDNQLRVQTEYR
jgi:competence protein ComEC